jgi:hypothetical protein
MRQATVVGMRRNRRERPFENRSNCDEIATSMGASAEPKSEAIAAPGHPPNERARLRERRPLRDPAGAFCPVTATG